MSLKIIELSGLKVAGVVVTAPMVPDASTGSNAAAISRIAGQRRMKVPRVDDPEEGATHLEEVIRWLELE